MKNIFKINDEQQVKICDWDSKHYCSLKGNSGTIGGRLSYIFNPTSLGTGVIVRCGCGAEIDVTEYENW